MEESSYYYERHKMAHYQPHLVELAVYAVRENRVTDRDATKQAAIEALADLFAPELSYRDALIAVECAMGIG